MSKQARERGFTDLKVGKHYVFFESLRTESNPFYTHGILPIGEGYVNELHNAISLQTNNENENNLEALMRIENYINLVYEMAQNEQKNEQNFFSRMQLITEKDDKLQESFKPYMEQLKQGAFDYNEVIALINEIMVQHNKASEDREKRAKTSMTVLSENYDKLEDMESDIPEKIQKELEDKGQTKTYRKLIKENLLEPLDDTTKYEGTFTSIMASTINQVFNKLSSSPAVKEILMEQLLSKNKRISPKDAIIAIIMKDISNLDEEALKQFNVEGYINELLNNFSARLKTVSQLEVENAQSILIKKSKFVNSLDAIAFTTGKNLANIFMQEYSDQAKQEYFEHSGQYKQQLETLYHEIQKFGKASDKAKFTKILRKSIKERYARYKDFELPKGDQDTIRQYMFEYQNDKIDNQFKNTRIENIIRQNFNVKVKYFDLAEYLVTHANTWFPQMLMGKSIKFRTDVAATLTFDQNWHFGIFDDIKDKRNKTKLRSKVDNFIPRMLDRYKQLNEKKGNAEYEADVANAVRAYRLGMQDIRQGMDKLEKLGQIDEDDRKVIIAQLNSFLLESIQVKEYAYYTNQIGIEIHNGPLGANTDKILDNINKMYTWGGLSPVDKDLLYFGIINCGEGALGHGLKEDLATYLLGGAAMMMFDDGFTATTKFMKAMIKEFGFFMGSLHLYVINGKYIPASYIYYSVYNSLMDFYSQLVATTKIDNISISNRVIISNPITPATNPGYLEKPIAQDRWDYVKDQAAANVNIRFIFMAGLLDIFEGIQQAIVPKV